MGRKKKQEPYVAIRLSASTLNYEPSNRHILWIDSHWYQTTTTPTFCVPESKIEEVKQQLHSHFLNFAVFIYPDGQEKKWSFFDQFKYNDKTAFGKFKGGIVTF